MLIRVVCLLFGLIAWQGQTALLMLSDDPKDKNLFSQQSSQDLASDSYQLLFAELPHYPVDIQIAPITRINTILNGNTPVCALSRIKTKLRQMYHLYSLPVHLFPSHRLYYYPVQQQIDPDLLNLHGELRGLTQLMSRYPKAVLAIETSKSYGPSLDAQIEQIPADQLLTRAGSDAYAAMIAMFEKKRSNFLIAYPSVFKQYAEANTLTQITSLSIAENPAYIPGHIACSKSPQTEAFLVAVNKALLKLYRSPEFLDMHLHYVPPSDKDMLMRRIGDLVLSAATP
ncbi:hypothetical protein ACFOEE_17445 [Pseudoalteromonas fenneropenaei]|uniref:ABC transporter substrate-binding protein n=1 Tax=Pseudoalteromonas fenneropenaei TaxID=1737459 RepID=A0ABV7CP44_9GAMM